MGHWGGKRGPMFVCYDQEPILPDNFHYELLDHIENNYQGPFVLVTTEKNSEPLNALMAKYQWPVVYYFHHALAAHDWYRGYRYDARLIPPDLRKLDRHYISMNRLTSERRVYRSLLINELIKQDILDQGYVSFSRVCPEGGVFQDHLIAAANQGQFSLDLAQEAITNIDNCASDFRIDFVESEFIPNHSMILGAIDQTQRSFCFVVTETCFWEHKCHLTEKIFKPIIARMPFILTGPAHNLAYLRSYGFKTFSDWWDESYDDITDPIQRLEAIGKLLKSLCAYNLKDLEKMLTEMMPVLDHNFNLFNSQDFLDGIWFELATNLKSVADGFDSIDYPVNVKRPGVGDKTYPEWAPKILPAASQQ
jgi:hypothetical protein